MTSDQLKEVLQKLGVVRWNNSNVAACKVCQPEATDPNEFKLYVNSGSKLPVVLFCMRCCVPKATEAKDKTNNKHIIHYNLVQSGVDTETFYTPMDKQEIELLWEGRQTQKLVIVDRANDNVLHHCYSDLLDRLELNERHRRWLSRRGSVDDFYTRGYRSTPTQNQSRQYAAELYAKSGRQVCDKVPGLTEGRWLLREGALLIPCRDEQGRIGALKQRLMQDGPARMRLVAGGGTKAKQMVHFPLGSKVNKGMRLWITEGERKADVLYQRIGESVCGVPGTGSIEYALEPACRAQTVVLALDKDEAGAKTSYLFAKRLLDRGVKVEAARWSNEYKKIDDALIHGCQVDCVGVDYSWFENTKKVEKPTDSGILYGEAAILAYINSRGSVLRSEVKAHPAEISALIRTGRVKMEKTNEGQVLTV